MKINIKRKDQNGYLEKSKQLVKRKLKIYNPKTSKQTARKKLKMDDKELDKELAEKWLIHIVLLMRIQKQVPILL